MKRVILFLFNAVLMQLKLTVSRQAYSCNSNPYQFLVEEIIGNVSTDARHSYIPKRTVDEPVQVTASAVLKELINIDQRNNMATISLFFELHWQDYRIGWSPQLCGNITHVYVPIDKVWVPELQLYHRFRSCLCEKESNFFSVDGRSRIEAPEMSVNVYSDGKAIVMMPFVGRALCPIDVREFPFDKQTCNFDFGAWSFDDKSLAFRVISNSIDLCDFYDNQEWELIYARFSQADRSYFSEHGSNQTYSTMRITLRIRRQYFFYCFNLVIPVMLVSTVAIIGFFQPERREGMRTSKYRLGMMALVSLGVMLLNIVAEMPKFSFGAVEGKRGSFSGVPLLGIFYISLITNVSVATCNTQWFVWLERTAAKRHRQGRALPLPWYLRLIDYIFDRLWCHSAHTYSTRQLSANYNQVQLNERKAIMQHANEHTMQDSSPNALQPLTVDVSSTTTSQNELEKLTAQLHQLTKRIDAFLMGNADACDYAAHHAPVKLWRRAIRRLEICFLCLHLFVVLITIGLLFTGYSHEDSEVRECYES